MIRVVAAVLVRTGDDGVRRVLACRRTHPAALAGKWEFPGGKVEPGEDDRTALHRELAEELRVRVELSGPLGPELPMVGGSGVWQPYVGRITAGEPQLVDHDALRWLTAEQLGEVEWLASDVPVMADVADLLAASSD